MEIKYIAIEREYGSGGVEIAQKTAESCNIPCYGEEIIEAVAKRQNVPLDALQEYEERASNSFLYSLFVMSQGQTGNPDLLSSEAKLFVAESRIIKELASKGPAVFLGHGACRPLEDLDGVLKVFIHADDESKKRRITEDYKIPKDKVEETCRKINKSRGNYYNFCTQKKWNDFTNYDVVLDSSRLGIEGCACALTGIFKNSL